MKSNVLNLAKENYIWLRSRGGRNSGDVLQDKKGLFVLMLDGRGKELKIYLPKKYEDKVK